MFRPAAGVCFVLWALSSASAVVGPHLLVKSFMNNFYDLFLF